MGLSSVFVIPSRLDTAIAAHEQGQVAATQTMLDRAEERFDLRPRRLAADTAYGTGKFLAAGFFYRSREKQIVEWAYRS
jgi:hypothetical protein